MIRTIGAVSKTRTAAGLAAAAIVLVALHPLGTTARAAGAWGGASAVPFGPPTSGVAALVAQVHTDTLENRVLDLESFETRRADTAQCRAAAEWIAARFRAFGADSVYVQNWSRGYAPNVVAIRRGTTHPREVVLIGGHFDSISYFSTFAPGADDNASGTSCVLECARILCGARFERTLQFAAFSAEEFGLFGSNAYARHVSTRDSVVAMINVDMIGYRAPADRRDLDLIGRPESAWLRDAIVAAGASYVPDLPLVDGAYSGGARSDHESFWAWGMDAIGFFEDSGAPSPFIHTADDIFGQSYNDAILATQSTRVAVASLATLATHVEVPVWVQDLEATAGPGSIGLVWRLAPAAVAALTAVSVERAPEPAGPLARRGTALTPAPQMSFVDGDVEAAQLYYYRLVVRAQDGSTTPVGPIAVHASAPSTLFLVAEPAGASAVEVRYAVGPVPARTQLAIYDARGRRVRLLETGWSVPGTRLRTWDRRDDTGAPVARGVYLVHLDAGGSQVTRKLVLLQR